MGATALSRNYGDVQTQQRCNNILFHVEINSSKSAIEFKSGYMECRFVRCTLHSHAGLGANFETR